MAKINVRDRNKNKPDKKPNWEYRFEAAQVDGKRKHISKAGFKTKKEALDAGAKALAEYNNAGTRFEPSTISVSDYLDLWFVEYCKPNLRYNTCTAYKNLIEKHLKPHFGIYRLSTITPLIIQQYTNDICLSGYSHSHIVGILSTFQCALDYAVHPLCFIKDNPMRYIKYPPRGKKRERIILEKDEFDEILKRFPFGNRFHIPLLLGWNCGLRISEALALTWDDVDFEAKTITIDKQIIKKNFDVDYRYVRGIKDKKEEKCGWYFTEPKYNSVRTIKVGDSLLEVLQKEKARQEEMELKYEDYYTIHISKQEKDEKGQIVKRIIPVMKCVVSSTYPRVKLINIDENGQYTSVDSCKYLSRVINRQMHIAFDYHSLRHTHATILIESGVSPKAVQQRLGHKSIVTTLQTYVHATDDLQAQAVDAIEKINRKESDDG